MATLTDPSIDRSPSSPDLSLDSQDAQLDTSASATRTPGPIDPPPIPQ